MDKVKCKICGSLISKSRIKIHTKSKNCLKLKKRLFSIQNWYIKYNQYRCPVCYKIFTKNGIINHYYRKHTTQGVKWMKDFHDSKFNTKGLPSTKKGKTKFNDESIMRQSNSIKKRYISGELQGSFKGRHHTKETKNKQSTSARNSNHRRLVKSCRYYIKKDDTQVLLDSSWEEKLAKILDDKHIKWERPKPLKWVDNAGNIHNYFPDFYLPEYNLYLDPKNPQACIKQKEKIDILYKMYNNIIILHTIDEIERVEDFIKTHP